MQVKETYYIPIQKLCKKIKRENEFSIMGGGKKTFFIRTTAATDVIVSERKEI